MFQKDDSEEAGTPQPNPPDPSKFHTEEWAQEARAKYSDEMICFVCRNCGGSVPYGDSSCEHCGEDLCEAYY